MDFGASFLQLLLFFELKDVFFAIFLLSLRPYFGLCYKKA